MKLLQVVTVAQGCFLASAHGLSRGGRQALTKNDEAGGPMEFNPAELLDSRSRKPEIYTKAMFELKRLEEEPTCHRVAVHLLMNNCHGLEDIGEEAYQVESSHLQKHHVESFAASLAICDLERGKFDIPHACTSFTGSALNRVARDGNGKLQVSPEQVGGCLEALGQDHSHWNTWLSYRDKALLFCRAARFDIDRDQAIQHHKKLLKIMDEFAENLDADLNNVKESMAEHRHATSAYFDGIKSHLGNLRDDIQDTMGAMSHDITGLFKAMKSSFSTTEDLDRMLKNLFHTMARGNAEMAAGQEQALEVTTSYTKSQMERINDLAAETAETVAGLKESVLQLFPAVMALNERQDSLDQRTEVLHGVVTNITILLENHTENLEQATLTASGIHSSLEKAAAAANSWNENLKLGGSLGPYAVRISTPLAFLFLGNYGLPPSLSRNVALLLGGAGFGEMLVQFRQVEWARIRMWYTEPSPATALTHLAREHLRTQTTTSTESIPSP